MWIYRLLFVCVCMVTQTIVTEHNILHPWYRRTDSVFKLVWRTIFSVSGVARWQRRANTRWRRWSRHRRRWRPVALTRRRNYQVWVLIRWTINHGCHTPAQTNLHHKTSFFPMKMLAPFGFLPLVLERIFEDTWQRFFMGQMALLSSRKQCQRNKGSRQYKTLLQQNSPVLNWGFVSDIAIFVLKRDVKLQQTYLIGVPANTD